MFAKHLISDLLSLVTTAQPARAKATRSTSKFGPGMIVLIKNEVFLLVNHEYGVVSLEVKESTSELTTERQYIY